MASPLSDSVLPLIRTRADLSRYSAANAHGAQMWSGVELLREAAVTEDPREAFTVTQKAIASAVRVILRADDSSGVIGDVIRELLALHAELAAAAAPQPSVLVKWLINFQFDGTQDFFEPDPVAYADALGDDGVARYRSELDRIRAEAGLDDRHVEFLLDYNDRRLAVLDRDVDAVIATHARDRAVPAWFDDTAAALAEIGEFDLAIDWAHRAVTFEGVWHQSQRATKRWFALVDEHRSPEEAVAARVEAFRRWPSASFAAQLHAAAGAKWRDYEPEVMLALAKQSALDVVAFALYHLGDVDAAWTLAHEHDLDDRRVWSDLAGAYEAVDPSATLPVHRRLVDEELVDAGASHYRRAAKRLVRMRRLAAGTGEASTVDAYIVDLRDAHRRRPTLQKIFDRAGLPSEDDT